LEQAVLFLQCAEMETLKLVRHVIQVLLFPEPSVALHSAPAFLSELLVDQPQANAQRDQNVDDRSQVDNWCVTQEWPGQLVLDVDVEDSSHEKLAKLMELAPNKFITFVLKILF